MIPSMPNLRLSYEESCRRLQKDYLGEGVIPPLPDHLPHADDEEPLGVSFFRTFVGEGDDLSNLFLPHTFFGRSKVNNVKFRNTDFTESNLCWNDFIDVDFTDAILAGSDMRASVFQRVKFVRADLRRTDLRRSSFDECLFDGALMERAVVARNQKAHMRLSTAQIDGVAWTHDEGEEPDGG
jgi:uncharacterized protein YjbI with pentapeptide repeats